MEIGKDLITVQADEEQAMISGKNQVEVGSVLESIRKIVREIELPVNEVKATKRIVEELEKRGYIVEYVSDRNGLRIILVEKDDERYILWIRSSPLTRKALELAERILKPYEDITGMIIVKTTKRADYIRVKEWKQL